MPGNGRGIHGIIDEKARPECPSCGANEWTLPDNVSAVVLACLDDAGQPIRGGGIKTIAYICMNCAFIRLHSVTLLEEME